jgi:hypothetical protein
MYKKIQIQLTYIAGFEIKQEISSWLTLLGRLGLDGYSDRIMFPMNSSENGNGFGTESVTDFKSFNDTLLH